MTLLDCLGLYVGWDKEIPILHLQHYCGSVQVQIGHLLLGCDWFFNHTDARHKCSTLQGEDGRVDVASLPHPRVVSGEGC